MGGVGRWVTCRMSDRGKALAAYKLWKGVHGCDEDNPMNRVSDTVPRAYKGGREGVVTRSQ